MESTDRRRDQGRLNRFIGVSRLAARRSSAAVLGAFLLEIISLFTSSFADEPGDKGQESPALPKNGVIDVVAYATSQINAVAVSSDGKYVAGGGMDRSVRVWKLDSGEALHRMAGSQGIIRAVAFQPRGSLLATGGDEPVVRIWDTSTGKPRKVLRGVRPGTTSLAFSPDGHFLAGSISTRTGANVWLGDVMLWDVESGDLVRVVESQANEYYRGVAFSPDSTLLAWAFDTSAPHRSSGVKLWGTKKRELKATLLRDRGGSLGVAFSPDGRYVASGGGYVAVNDGQMATGEVKIWDVETQELVETLARPDGGGYVAPVFSPHGAIAGQGFGPVTTTPTESRVISEVTLWNPATKEPLWNARFAFCGDPSPPAFSPDGTKLVTCDSEAVRVLDADNGQILRLLMEVEHTPVTPPRLPTNGGDSNSTELKPPVPAPRELPAKRAKAKSPVVHLRGIETGSRHAEAIAFTSDGRLMASCGFDSDPPDDIAAWRAGKAKGVLQISDVAEGRVLGVFHGTAGAMFDVAVSPDDRLIATAGRVRNDPQLGEVTLWDVDSQQEKMTFKGHTGWVLSVAFSPDGRLLASGGFDKVARIWDVASGELVAELPQQEGTIDVVAFGPDGGTLATATRRGVVSLWDTATWQKNGGFSKEGLFLLDLGFSPNGRWVAAGGTVEPAADVDEDKRREQEHGLVLLYELGADKPAGEIDIAGRFTTSVSFSADSRLLSALSMPGSHERPGGVTIYRLADQSLFTTIPTAQSSSCDALRFLPNGPILAAADIRGTVSFWSVEEKRDSK
ncbi:MAG TPA: WD40 repeat domain-containing protein [Pirellulales bacterium]|nr:WD40 repeat domain-containing protein [Pirellulales bacterium]